MPAGQPDVVVKRVRTVPAEDNVAKSQARAGPEFFERNVFSAQDAVHIKTADFHLLNVVGGEELLDFIKGHVCLSYFGF